MNYSLAARFHITLAMVVTGLRDIAERFPSDHKGTLGDGDGCAYVSHQNVQRLVPSCIVGQFFSDLGILRALVGNSLGGKTVADSCNLTNAGAITNRVRQMLEDDWGITMDDDAHTLMSLVQAEQDSGSAWPVAVETGERRLLMSKNLLPRTASEAMDDLAGL